MRQWSLIAFALFASAGLAVADDSPPAPVFGDGFWKQWGDGQAELSGYDLRFNRYGESREGTAVAIFVTETFSNSARVKADYGQHPKDDEFPVMKLNLVEDLPTGVYDYNLMTSAFVSLSAVNGFPVGAPTKVSFSSQEWCGHVYQQSLFNHDDVQVTSHSYFDGEADQDFALETKANGTTEDVLLLWARGFAYPQLERGETAKLPILRSAETARLMHDPVQWETATFSRAAGTSRVEVPAGTFEVETRRVEIDGAKSRTWTFYVEAAAPHRLVRWENSMGQEASLLASDRMKYWQMNGPGGEAALAKLGLSPRAQRVP